MNNLNLSTITHTISQFMHRFHVTIFVVFVVGGLSLATLFLQQVITAPPQADTGVSDSASTFDDATMGRISNLHTTDDKSSLTLPHGRINPFRTSR